MQHEKIIKRADSSQVKIHVSVWLSSSDDKAIYKVGVYTREPRKRNWLCVYSSDDYEYRRLSQVDREAYILNKQLQYVTAEELQAAKLELWEKLKPTT